MSFIEMGGNVLGTPGYHFSFFLWFFLLHVMVIVHYHGVQGTSFKYMDEIIMKIEIVWWPLWQPS